jgi:formylglycine-generating enzyme required for sulfatase activity
MKKAAIFLFILLISSALWAQQKYALVIGNGAYTGGLSQLRNTVNDANDMETALKGLGFTVEKVLDGNLDRMESAIMRLKNRLSAARNSYGFLFYAGHGVQSNGVNYLIPVGANIPSENFLRERAVSVQAMLDELNDAKNELNVVVLDACRDNPFGWSRSTSRGLTVVQHQPADSIIVFATSAGSKADDGTGRNGLFTTHLLNNLKTPGLEVSEVFRRTGSDVSRASNRQQIPAIYNQFFETAYLGTRGSTPTPTPQPTPTPTVNPTPTPTPSPSVQPVSGNMVRINGGTFMMGSPTNEPERNGETQHQVTVSLFYMGRHEVTQKEYQEIMGTNPSYLKGDNLPVERVSWYDAVEYCNRRSQREGFTPAYTIDKSRTDPNNNGDDRLKWVVTWNRNANGYRLPTEAEWEYACRAGTTTTYNTGATINDNTGWYDANSDDRTHPVGQKSANRWGLYDMHGNVYEWCWDWFGTYPSGAQTDPMGVSSGSMRVIRGGSFFNTAQRVRSALRSSIFPNSVGTNVGFRVVRNA